MIIFWYRVFCELKAAEAYLDFKSQYHNAQKPLKMNGYGQTQKSVMKMLQTDIPCVHDALDIFSFEQDIAHMH